MPGRQYPGSKIFNKVDSNISHSSTLAKVTKIIIVSPSTGDPHETEMDSVLLLTSEAYYVADYDETSDRVLSVQRVPLPDLVSIELGTFDANPTVTA